ncbi:MAG: histidine phosphatase family protein [Planctomycetes bacterium]|nr:histidine phosphatase family protein [Planctomycetota bacterium]
MTPPALPYPADGDTWMYLLRHGATENNVANPPRLQGRGADFPLSAEGQAQAGRAAELLRDRPIVAIYCSPLLRARQTAETLSSALHLPIQLVNAIIEVDVGLWEGRDWGEIEKTEPEAFHRFMEDPGTWPYAGGESMGEVQRRVVPALDELLAQHPGQSIVVVSHNVVNRCYLAHLLGLPLAKARAIAQENCGVNVIRRRSGKTNLVTLNSAFHLG